MKKLLNLLLKMENSAILYGTAFIFAAVLYGVLLVVSKKILGTSGFLYNFFFNGWQVQFANSWLFMTGIMIIAYKVSLLRAEKETAGQITLPESPVYQENVEMLINGIPKDKMHIIVFRRFRMLLQALLRGEDVIHLNEELSRRDMETVERGHVTLNNLKYLCPVLGFLGKIAGLSMGMVRFPEIASKAQGLEGIKEVLKNFAGDMSLAFNTTILGLVHAVILILLSSWLFTREEAMVEEVDELGRKLINKMKTGLKQTVSKEDTINIWNKIKDGLDQVVQLIKSQNLYQKEIAANLQMIGERLPPLQEHIGQNFFKGMQIQGGIIVQKLEEIRAGVQRPPQYQVVVQPLNGDRPNG